MVLTKQKLKSLITELEMQQSSRKDGYTPIGEILIKWLKEIENGTYKPVPYNPLAKRCPTPGCDDDKWGREPLCLPCAKKGCKGKLEGEKYESWPEDQIPCHCGWRHFDDEQ